MPESALFGRYLPGSSVVHRLDARMKLVLVLAVMIIVFCATNALSLAICAVFIAAFYAAAKISPLQALRAIGPLLVIVVFTGMLNLVFVQGGTVYFRWWFIAVSEAGVHAAVFLSVRLTLLILIAGLLTLTTTTGDMTEAGERLLGPLTHLHVPVHELAMIMGLALRFLPEMARSASALYRAQTSRGAVFSADPFSRRGRTSLVSLIVPLFAGSFRQADTLGEAMEARCYRSDAERTRLVPFRLAPRDGLAAAIVMMLFACVLLADHGMVS